MSQLSRQKSGSGSKIFALLTHHCMPLRQLLLGELSHRTDQITRVPEEKLFVFPPLLSILASNSAGGTAQLEKGRTDTPDHFRRHKRSHNHLLGNTMIQHYNTIIGHTLCILQTPVHLFFVCLSVLKSDFLNGEH